MKKVRLDELPPRMRKQAEQQLAASGRKVAGADGQRQPASHHAPHGGLQVPQIVSPVYLVVLCRRTLESWDLDNISVKGFVDAIVEEKILVDDRSSQIKGFLVLPEVVKTKEEETTDLEFWDAEFFGPYIEAARRNAKGE